MRSMSGGVCEGVAKRRSERVSRIGGRRERFGRPSGVVGERHAGDGDVRLHPIRLPLDHRLHLEVLLGDPEAFLDHARTQGIILQVLEGPISQNGYIVYKIKTLTDPMDPNKKLLRHSARP